MDTLLNLSLTSFIFVFGASIGSFLNVVIYRVPAGLSLIHPPLAVRNAFTNWAIPKMYPFWGGCGWEEMSLVQNSDFATLSFSGSCLWLLFCLVFWQYTFSWTTVGYWVLVSWLLILGLIDFDTMILPNVFTQSGLVLGVLFQFLLGWNTGNPVQGLMSAVGSAVLGIWLFDIIRWVGTIALGQPAMGGGDPKLAAMIGAWLGWQALLVTAFLACALGSVIGISAITFGWLNRGQPMPFSPFLALGAALTIFWGDTIIETYKSLLFPWL